MNVMYIQSQVDNDKLQFFTSLSDLAYQFYFVGCAMTVVGLQVLMSICRSEPRNVGHVGGLKHGLLITATASYD